MMASNTVATQVLEFATNRLNQFYNPNLYKLPAKVELSSGDRIHTSMGNAGGLVNTVTVAPGGIAGNGFAVPAQVLCIGVVRMPQRPLPATWIAYARKSEENTRYRHG